MGIAALSCVCIIITLISMHYSPLPLNSLVIQLLTLKLVCSILIWVANSVTLIRKLMNFLYDNHS